MISDFSIEEILKAQLRDELNKQFDEYKEKILKELNWEIEKKRGGIIEERAKDVFQDIARAYRDESDYFIYEMPEGVVYEIRLSKINTVNAQCAVAV